LPLASGCFTAAWASCRRRYRWRAAAMLDEPGAIFRHHEIQVALTGALEAVPGEDDAVIFGVAGGLLQRERALQRVISGGGIGRIPEHGGLRSSDVKARTGRDSVTAPARRDLPLPRCGRCEPSSPSGPARAGVTQLAAPLRQKKYFASSYSPSLSCSSEQTLARIIPQCSPLWQHSRPGRLDQGTHSHSLCAANCRVPDPLSCKARVVDSRLNGRT